MAAKDPRGDARIPDELYGRIVRAMPIACVDLLVTDAAGRVLLIRRKSEPARGQWWFPGGRVHYRETRREAAVRKLAEECGLTAGSVTEIGTFDVILDDPSAGAPKHGITTLFRMVVAEGAAPQLDGTSAAADWRTAEKWQEVSLHSFVLSGIRSVACSGNWRA